MARSLLYVPLDVEFANDPAIMRAGALAELLFIRSLALSKRLMRDGQIDTAHLPLLALGLPGRPEKHAAALVAESLWRATPTGWEIPSWTKHNKTRDQVEVKRQKKIDAAALGNHARWHVKEGRHDPECRYCLTTEIAGAIVQRERCESSEAEAEAEALRPSSSGFTTPAPNRNPDDDEAWIQAEVERRLVLAPSRAPTGSQTARNYRNTIEADVRAQTRNGTNRPTPAPGPARNRDEAEIAASNRRALELAGLTEETA